MPGRLLRRFFPYDVHHLEGLHAELCQRIPEAGRVLDLGCGANKALAGYRTPSREVWGADFVAHQVLHDPAWFRPLGTAGSIPFPTGYFDVVVAIMVLEHVASPRVFFQEVARVLRPGGYFVGHTISGAHYVTWLRRLIGLLPHASNQWLVRKLYGRAESDTFPAYYRLNRSGQIERAGLAAGLSNLAITRYADPGYFMFSRPVHATAIAADWLLEKVSPGWGRLYFTATLRKAPDISANWLGSSRERHRKTA